MLLLPKSGSLRVKLNLSIFQVEIIIEVRMESKNLEDIIKNIFFNVDGLLWQPPYAP